MKRLSRVFLVIPMMAVSLFVASPQAKAFDIWDGLAIGTQTGLIDPGSILSGVGASGTVGPGRGSGTVLDGLISGRYNQHTWGVGLGDLVNYDSSGRITANIPGLGVVTYNTNTGRWTLGYGSFGNSIGAVINNLVYNSMDLPALLSAFAYMFGLILGVMGILKLKDHVMSPDRTPLSDALKRFLVGGALFALPVVIEASYRMLASGIYAADQSYYNVSGYSGGGLDAMMVFMMSDIWNPIHNLIGAFCYLAGLGLIIIGISRLLKTSQDGPRGPAGMGTLMTFIVGAALLSADSMMGAFIGTLFADDTTRNFGELAYTSGMTDASLAHAHTVISAVLAFMAIIGWISFVRGWFILRSVAEGGQQGSLMAGVTHVFGGALAVNLGGVLNVVQNTFGIAGYGILFS